MLQSLCHSQPSALATSLDFLFYYLKIPGNSVKGEEILIIFLKTDEVNQVKE